eukprot:PLAT15917.1.p1 GENE.PLAT15917.1~~PLAT15917.1.p1  ORF type:complete len:125 (+),score=62.95 PLAT15917.1:175-549(+)
MASITRSSRFVTTGGSSMLLRARIKRAERGLFAGKETLFGNNVSHSKQRTRRSWKPNVQVKRLWSEHLERWVRVPMTTSAMRSIDKMGGLDNYLLLTKPAKLDSRVGDMWRRRILAALDGKALA